MSSRLEELKQALEDVDQSLLQRLRTLGLAPFGKLLANAWREEVNRVFDLQLERLSQQIADLLLDELTTHGPRAKGKAQESSPTGAAPATQGEAPAAATPKTRPSRGSKAAGGGRIAELERRIEELTEMLRSREEEINRLYNLTEQDPKYQAYHVLRDLAPNWVEISHVARSLGLPSQRIRRFLEEFAESGLVEVKGTKARAIQLIRRADTTASTHPSTQASPSSTSRRM